MFRQSLRESNARIQILFAGFVILTCGMIILLFSMVYSWLVYGLSPTEMTIAMQDFSNPESIQMLRFFQTTQTIGIFILPPFLIAWFLHEHPFEFLKFHKPADFKSVLFVIAIVYFANPLINWLTEINSKLSLPEWMSAIEIWMQNSEATASKITEAFLATTSLSTLFSNLIMIAILPALGEELLFRGVLQQLIKKGTGQSHLAIWVTAAIFSALHLQFFGFLPRLILGAMFGYMLEWSGTLWLPIIAHFVNNGTAVIAYFLIQKGLIGEGIDKTGTTSDGSAYMVIVSLLFLYAFSKALYLRTNAKKENERLI